MQEIIKSIRHRFSELTCLKEENIKIHIVLELFLNKLGFNPKYWVYEDSVSKDRADMTYRINEKAVFLVETKGLSKSAKMSDLELTLDDRKQITEYLNSHQDNIVWGLLTNGKRYILFNNNIKGGIDDKIVFDISVDNKKDQNFIKYFSYENLFVTKNTTFFADIAQFKYYRKNTDVKKSSWNVYKSTLFNFFDYYAANHQYRSMTSNLRECLTRITVEDFLSYMNGKTQVVSKKSGKAVTSKQTIQNNYSYLAAFFGTLKEMGDISEHSFKYSRERSLSDYENTPKIKSKNYLSIDRYEKILNHIFEDKNNYRNMIIFLLCSYYGFERSEVNELVWSNVDTSKEKITVNGRSYKMDILLKTCLEKLYCEKIKSKSKNNYVITTYNNKRIRKANTSTINAVFDSFKNIDGDYTTWCDFSPQYTRECLIRTMFESGYSLEQLSAYIGVDITRIISCIPSDIIALEGRKRLNKGNKQVVHPYKDVVETFYNKQIA